MTAQAVSEQLVFSNIMVNVDASRGKIAAASVFLAIAF
jgi:hypothetical protein